MWITDNEMVGQRVAATDLYGDEFEATIVAVSDRTDRVKVKDQSGEIFIGNQWEFLD